jgi:rhamnosyltransferase subunit B
MLDPYDGYRLQPLRSPSVANPCPQIASQGGDEIFVYAFERAMNFAPLWEGLRLSGYPVRVYIPDISALMAEALRARGIMVEHRPQSFADIGRRSRFVLSHGGHGFVCSALLAGLPQVVTHYDLEKSFMGDAIARNGLGGHIALQDIKAEPFADSLRQFYHASAVQRDVRKTAEKLHEEMGPGSAADVIEAVEELIG